MPMRMKKLNKLAFFIVVLFIFFFIFAGKKIFRSFTENKKEYQYLSLFSEVTSLVKTDYVEKVKPGAKFPGAYSAMLGALDKFSAYLDTGKTGIYRLYRQGSAYECGIYGSKISNYFYITGVAKNSTAEAAGLKPGDIIKAVNGKSIYSLSFWEMYLSLLTNKPGTIEIVLLKNRTTKASKINLKTQRTGEGPIVKKIEPGILLVDLSRIDRERVTALKRELGEAAAQHPFKLIIDLRKYNGGDLESFVRLTKLFFNQTIPLTLKLKHKKETFLLGANANEALTYHAVVVVNKSTMMYGELLAYLFKTFQTPERPAAVTLIGSKTRGFISKLKHIPLDDGSSILLTEGLFLLKGKNPAKTGVTPDVKIKETDAAKIIDRGISILTNNRKKNPDKTHDQDQEKT